MDRVPWRFKQKCLHACRRSLKLNAISMIPTRDSLKNKRVHGAVIQHGAVCDDRDAGGWFDPRPFGVRPSGVCQRRIVRLQHFRGNPDHVATEARGPDSWARRRVSTPFLRRKILNHDIRKTKLATECYRVLTERSVAQLNPLMVWYSAPYCSVQGIFA
jgi:hypothetical protein